MEKLDHGYKKAFCILLSFMLMLSITACGGDDEPKETEKNDNGKPGTSVSTEPDTTASEITGEIYDTGELRAWFLTVGRHFRSRTCLLMSLMR